MIYSTFVIVGLIFATILGIFGHVIAYDLNEQFPTIKSMTAMTILTFISIGLYVIIPISLLIFNKIPQKYLIVSVITCFLIGLPVSIWSFFVWVAWMG
ncbi:Mitochondrial carrier protein [Sporosarcina sp. ANT_H38]